MTPVFVIIKDMIVWYVLLSSMKINLRNNALFEGEANSLCGIVCGKAAKSPFWQTRAGSVIP